MTICLYIGLGYFYQWRSVRKYSLLYVLTKLAPSSLILNIRNSKIPGVKNIQGDIHLQTCDIYIASSKNIRLDTFYKTVYI